MAALSDRRLVWSATLLIVVTTLLILLAFSLIAESFEEIEWVAWPNRGSDCSLPYRPDPFSPRRRARRSATPRRLLHAWSGRDRGTWRRFQSRWRRPGSWRRLARRWSLRVAWRRRQSLGYRTWSLGSPTSDLPDQEPRLLAIVLMAASSCPVSSLVRIAPSRSSVPGCVLSPPDGLE